MASAEDHRGGALIFKVGMSRTTADGSAGIEDGVILSEGHVE
jgi:hypothetical protein